MATLRVEIQGRPREITLTAFLIAIDNVRRILADLEEAVSPTNSAALEWVVTDLRMGSLAIALESQQTGDDTDIAPIVTRAFVDGMEIIEKEGRTPPYFSEHSMRCAQRVVNLIGRDGTTGLEVADFDHVAQLSAQAAASVGQLVKVRSKSFGSVEGRLETVSVHRGSKFVVYHTRTGKGITCTLAEDRLLEQAIAVLGKRAIVIGTVYANARGEPMRIQVQSLRHIVEDSELPRIEDIGGSDPGLTGDLSTEEYIRSVRGG